LHSTHHHHPHRSVQPATGSRTPSNNFISRDASSTALNGSGYESDRSSNSISGLQAQLENLVDDDEDVGSLTRQLAETAQGVREMSKQLGSSLRVITSAANPSQAALAFVPRSSTSSSSRKPATTGSSSSLVSWPYI
jgi:hypothetical protein